MTFDWISKEFVAPAFFFLGLIMMVWCGAGIYLSFAGSAGYVVLSFILFILGWIAGRIGLRTLGIIAAEKKPPALTGVTAVRGDDLERIAGRSHN